MNHDIHKRTERIKFTPRDAPYWAPPLGINQSLGFRKLGPVGTDEGTWIARRVKDNGYHGTKSLGYVSDSFGFVEAREAARKWFADQERGVADGQTVTDACRAYLEDRRTEKSEKNAADAEGRFERTVYGNDKYPAKPIAGIKLDKLRTADVKAWRNALTTPTEPDGKALSKAAANRTLSTLKAALNLAVENGLVSGAATIEWSRVKAHENASKQRNLYLDLKQRRALLKAAKGAIRNLIEASMLTGARAGELTSAARKQFDDRSAVLDVDGKTGPRSIPLSAPAAKLFTRLAKGKLPDARLLTRDDGKPWAHSDWDELVRTAAEKAKLPAGVCLYTLRHSFITQALQDGLPVSDVGKYVGTSAQMIEKNYHHLIHSHVRARLIKVVMA